MDKFEVIDHGYAQVYLKNGQYHREKGPAIVFPGVGEIWFKDGRVHREGGLPAILMDNGIDVYKENGLFHRLNGPAVDFPDGYAEWYLDGKKHCTTGPAVDQPACPSANEWYIDDVQLTEYQFLVKTGKIPKHLIDERKLNEPLNRLWYSSLRLHAMDLDRCEYDEKYAFVVKHFPTWYFRGFNSKTYKKRKRNLNPVSVGSFIKNLFFS